MNKVKFEEEAHTYTDTEDDSRYTSVTTVISKYEKEFDTEYWATYKAIKDVLSAKGAWQKFKKYVGGWNKVVEAYNTKPKLIGNESRKAICSSIRWYKDKWEEDGKVGMEIGTHIHKVLENKIIDVDSVDYGGDNLPSYKGNEDDIDKMAEIYQGVFAELLMYNVEYKIAGQADVVKKIGNDIWIGDYKTNKKLSDEPFNNERMLYPLDNIYDTTINRYMMQLSTYGWMLEQRGFNIKGLEIFHIDRESMDIKKTIQLDYSPDLVLRMLKDFKFNKC